MKIYMRHIKKARIEMLPMIDIVFLLLVFFIYAMLSMAVHRGLPVNLPTSKTVNIDKKLVLTVTIKSDGSIFVDKEPVELDRVTTVLQGKVMGQEEPGVLLFADRTLAYQNLFEVLDRIRQAGLNRISLQAELNESP
ncbi:MAG: biopolymer transporter ExbD [Desulfobacterales bacterium]|jgi:biopolymer transport protein ExbD